MLASPRSVQQRDALGLQFLALALQSGTLARAAAQRINGRGVRFRAGCRRLADDRSHDRLLAFAADP